ncbi:unnamed protein product [Pleuronectes platessa]|uniref:Uncharacterized protein n=1 Tax=Pleuronectes platessa TaxID=8262 RepID=A0A9N7UI18_PLEPL|nr:unnamed protein product [Pleuronectes platessa]
MGETPRRHRPSGGPQSDRGIRIRIAAHSPQCPSEELEGETEGAGGRRGMKGWGSRNIPCSHWPIIKSAENISEPETACCP